MKILFAIAVVSFAALIWAALAILRHVRKNSARAAAQPVADAEMSEAIDLRLSAIGRAPSKTRVPEAATDAEQNFSYFNRDGTVSPLEHKPYGKVPEPSKPVVVDRT